MTDHTSARSDAIRALMRSMDAYGDDITFGQMVDAVETIFRSDERARSAGIIEELENHIYWLPEHIASAIEKRADEWLAAGEVEASDALRWGARIARNFKKDDDE